MVADLKDGLDTVPKQARHSYSRKSNFGGGVRDGGGGGGGVRGQAWVGEGPGAPPGEGV